MINVPPGILTFTSRSGKTDKIYTYDINHERLLESFHFDDLISYFSPSWSNDKTKIAFTGIHFTGKSDIYIIDIETGNLDRLTNDFYDDRDPIWSENDNLLYFSSDRTIFGDKGYYNIFSYNLESGEIGFITYGANNDYAPALSNDGKYLAFSSGVRPGAGNRGD